MLTFAKIAAGTPSEASGMAKHLLNRTLPRDRAELAKYYTRGMETGEEGAGPRQDMHPLVAKGLGIDPDRLLSRDEINALLAGRRADGRKIDGKANVGYREFVDPKTGLKEEKVPIGSVDFCFSPDKSVSVAWAFATPAEQAAIYQAHRDAAEEAMRVGVEKAIGWTNRGDGGKDGQVPGHIAWIAFDHYTSRPTLFLPKIEGGAEVMEPVQVPVKEAGDMDLHTHFTVMNAVFCEGGHVGALDLDKLRQGFIKEAGATYQALLAANLRKLGADVVLDPDTGMARLAAIPKEVRDHFSKKTLHGQEAARAYAKEQGLDWDSLSPKRRARLLKAGTQNLPGGIDDETRAKLRKDDIADFDAWKRQAEDLGWRHETIVAQGPPMLGLTREQRIAMAYDEALPWLEKELNQRAVISGPDARAQAARGLIAWGLDEIGDIDRVTKAFREYGVRQYGEMTTLIWGKEEGKRHASITTGLHEQQEIEFISKARAASGDRTDALSARQIDRAIARVGLRFEGDHGRDQLAAIHRLGQGGRTGVLIGAAGAGKTTLLKPLVSAWQEEGRRVHGIALAWRQADDLVDAGIDKRDVKAVDIFMRAAHARRIDLGPKSVVVVDELSLLGTRQGLELLRLQKDHGFRLAMIGDDKQCQSIDAGPIIDLARKALGREQVPEILTTIRQQTQREKDIAGLFREGRATEALAMKREDGTAELVAGGYKETVDRVAELVGQKMRANDRDPTYSITVSAPTNIDAHRLGIAIREKRREMGQIGADAVTIKATDGDRGNHYDMALAAGDRVRLFASTRAEGRKGSIGRNGSVLTVVKADKRGIAVRNVHGNEGFIPWATLSDGSGRIKLAYGEVMTTHTAQGSTATEHIYALPAGSQAVNGFSAYSSSTRHRRSSYMVLSGDAEHAQVIRARPLGDSRPVSESDLWDGVAKNLGRQPLKDMALDFIRQAHDVTRGAARALQRGLMPRQLWERMGLRPGVVRERLRYKADLELTRRMIDSVHETSVARLKFYQSIGPIVTDLPRDAAAVLVEMRNAGEIGHHKPSDRAVEESRKIYQDSKKPSHAPGPPREILEELARMRAAAQKGVDLPEQNEWDEVTLPARRPQQATPSRSQRPRVRI